MATNKIVENDEREENKKGIIIFIIVLILLLALFIGIRALSNKEEDKNENKEQPVEEVKDEVVEEKEEDTSYVYTPAKSSKVKKTSNEEKKDTLTLVLKGSNMIYVDYADNYIDEGAYALDTKDGDISVSIIKTIYIDGDVVDTIDTTNSGATYIIKYVITNSRGEKKEVVRTVIIKEAEVLLTLNGASEQVLEYKTDTYVEENATAITNDGIDISSSITTTTTFNDTEYTGTINNDTLGTYVITYQVEYEGKTYTVKRTVTVKDTSAPIISSEKEEYKYQIDPTVDATITKDDIKTLFTVEDLDSNIETIITIISSDSTEIISIDKTIEGEYDITFTATDSSLNTTSKVIRILVMNDTEKPEISVSDISTDVTQYEFEITTTDNFSDTENIALSYAIVDDVNDITDDTLVYTDLSTNLYTITKAAATSTTAATKYIVFKAIDENGNENKSDPIEIFIEP